MFSLDMTVCTEKNHPEETDVYPNDRWGQFSSIGLFMKGVITERIIGNYLAATKCWQLLLLDHSGEVC